MKHIPIVDEESREPAVPVAATEDHQYANGNRTIRPAPVYASRFTVMVLGLLLFISWIFIFALFGLYATVLKAQHDTTSLLLSTTTLLNTTTTLLLNTTTTQIITLVSPTTNASVIVENPYNVTFPTNSDIMPTKVVSFDSAGNAMQGAGRTIYKNVTAMNAACPKYIDIDAVFNNSFLAHYQDKGTGLSILKVVTMDSLADISTVVETDTTAKFYTVTTLNQDTGLFVGISQAYSSFASFVTAGQVDAATSVVNLGTPQLYGCYQYTTVNPYLTRLSDTSFAITHYCSDASYVTLSVNTQYGRVNPTTKLVSLGPMLPYVNGTYAPNAYHNIVGLTAFQYLVMYMTPTVSLTVVKVTVDPTTFALTASDHYTIQDAKLDYNSYFQATRIDDSTAMVVYVDDATQGGLTAVLIEATTADRTVIRFGSRFAVTTGNSQAPKYSEYTYQGVTYGSYLSMDFSLTSIGSVQDSLNPGALIMYADTTNGAKWTVAVMEVTQSNEIVRSSPDFVLNKGSTLGIDSDHYGLSFETAMSSASDSRVAFFTTVSDGDCSKPAIADLSVFENMPSVAGIATASSGSSVSVQLGGIVSGLSGLRPGAVYYSDSRGNLIQSNIAYGRISGYSALSDYLETDSVIITLDSVVGVALSNSSLALGIL